MQRYIVARIILGVLLLFTVIFLIVRFAGNGDETTTEELPSEETTELVLSEQAETNSTVEMRIIGKINAKEDHRQILFSINRNYRKVSIIQGYDGKVIDSVRLVNTPSAYAEFVYAIDNEGFMATRDMEDVVSDPRGVCSNGRQYFFKVKTDDSNQEERWTSSCSSRRHGTFAGDRNDIENLFEDQFPNYREFTSGVRL